MGRGDKRSRKGKIVTGSYGKRRPRSANKAPKAGVEKPASKAKTAKA